MSCIVRPSGQMARERHDHTFQPTALVHEILQLIDQHRVSWQNRAQFYGVPAQLMRRIMLKYRGHNAEKRGGKAIGYRSMRARRWSRTGRRT